jgi:hypothetical protein
MPQFPSNISGLNGAIPTVYDPAWPTYVDLGPAQILAFQAFPQDLTNYVGNLRWWWEISSVPSDGSGPATSYLTIPAGHGTISGMQVQTDDRSKQLLAGLKQALDAGVLTIPPGGFPFIARNGVYLLSAQDVTNLSGFVARWVQNTFMAAATLLQGINAIPQTITTRAQVVAAFKAAMIVA